MDGMLGSLARWLRMLGYETEYDTKLDDNSLLQTSMQPETVLLTRDEELYKRAKAKSVNSVLVHGETEQERLAQLAKILGINLEIDDTGTRCPECGSVLNQISGPAASLNLAAASLKTHDKYWRCTNGACRKTYWVGSHWKQIRRKLEEARKIAAQER